MSDDKPTINVTRGKRNRRSRSKASSSAGSSGSSGLGLPGPGAVISGAIRGAYNAWWAGLGVLAVARDVGSQVFDALVEEGKSWEQAQRKRREKRAKHVQQLTEESGAVDAVEDRIREEVNNALQRVGVPHRDDIDELHEQIDALSDRLERIAQSVENADS
jgi:poly(hydroxyalkanoate) granule-associated protein